MVLRLSTVCAEHSKYLVRRRLSLLQFRKPSIISSPSHSFSPNFIHAGIVHCGGSSSLVISSPHSAGIGRWNVSFVRVRLLEVVPSARCIGGGIGVYLTSLAMKNFLSVLCLLLMVFVGGLNVSPPPLSTRDSLMREKSCIQ